MFKESILDKILYRVKKLIPKRLFNYLAPHYHTALAHLGAWRYGAPSRSLKVIGVTGTKGKSTTVYLIAKMMQDAGMAVAAVGSLGFKIKDKEWPNTLKMTMPGRMKLQKFLADARDAGCTHVVMEVTSEGIKQKRHLGINFDGAVFTNLHREHLEAHGSFENYMAAKEELFALAKNVHVINADDPYVHNFSKYPAGKTIFFGLHKGDMCASKVVVSDRGSEFELFGLQFKTGLTGEFNIYDCLAALATCAMYGLDLPTMQPILATVREIPGRMQFIQREPFTVVVDYAHTPDSLEAVYRTLSQLKTANSKLIAVLGAAGGGRDKWKRPEFGRIASEYCHQIILTDEDPYDENPLAIIEQIKSGLLVSTTDYQLETILDRREAIRSALSRAQKGDIVVVTGKGSEPSMALAGGRKISWSDARTVQELLG